MLVLRNMLVHTVDVLRRELVTDEYMSQVETWTTVKKNLRCRLSPLSSREQVFNQREGVKTTHRLYCKTADIRTTDLIQMGNRKFDVEGAVNTEESDELLVVSLEERT